MGEWAAMMAEVAKAGAAVAKVVDLAAVVKGLVLWVEEATEEVVTGRVPCER